MAKTIRNAKSEDRYSNITITYLDQTRHYKTIAKARQDLATINDEYTRYMGTVRSMKRKTCGAALSFDQ